MKTRWILGVVAISVVGLAERSLGQAAATTIEQMPAQLETQFALSAAPRGLRIGQADR